MAFDIAVQGVFLTSITVSGGKVILQEWPDNLARVVNVSLPQLALPTWPDLRSTYTPRQFAAGILLSGNSAESFASLWDSVALVCETTGTIVLTRTRDLLSGVQTRTAKAVYLGGMEPTMASHAAGKCMPRWQLLEDWHT